MEKRETRRLALVSAAAALVVLAATAAPAGGGNGSGAAVAEWTINSVGSTSWTPSTLTINAGDTVRWVNTGGFHNVVLEGPEGFERPDVVGVPPGDGWPVMEVLDTPGSYNFYCRPHRAAGMTGTITVRTTAPPPPQPPPPPPPGDPGGGTGGGGGGTGGGGGGSDDPGSGTPGGGKSSTTITLQVSDRTPERGSRVRFFGSVRPQQDGRRVQLQRRARGGSYRTVARIRLSDAGGSRSKFSKRLRMRADGVFRARLPADDDHRTGTSRKRRVNVS